MSTNICVVFVYQHLPYNCHAAVNERQGWCACSLQVGPETMSILELHRRFAKLNGRTLRPVFVDYRNFERVLNVASLGNLNRQFVSLLRSEQVQPTVGLLLTLPSLRARCDKCPQCCLPTTMKIQMKCTTVLFPIAVLTVGPIHGLLLIGHA